ncbi:hypothetical protein EGJ55_20095 [Pseudomonas moraviensis]|nr:hypothetical protein EGJ55_20095 [Pseudomonas moraviensis]
MGMPHWTLCVRFGTQSVSGCIPTQSVGTIELRWSRKSVHKKTGQSLDGFFVPCGLRTWRSAGRPGSARCPVPPCNRRRPR